MKTTLRSALLFLLLSLAACGGDETSIDADAGTDASVDVDGATSDDDAGPDDDSGDPNVEPCDEDPPSVAINPPSPVQVDFDAGSTTIRLDFDEPVTGVTPAAFAVDNGATVESVGGMDDIYDVTVSGLQASTTYTLTLPAEAVVDVCDNALDETLVIVIEVGDAPCELDTEPPTLTVMPTPPIELTSGTTETAVTLLFSEEIQGVTPTVDNAATIADVTNPQGNDWVVTITNLTDGTTQVTVPTSTLDACGNALASDFTFDIVVGTTDSTPPMVVSSTPNNGETGVALDTDIVFEFSEPMDTNAGTIDLTADGTAVAFTSAWSNSDRTLTIAPSTNFENGDGVAVVLNNFADPSGNALGSEVLAFTAIPDPCVFDTTPPGFSTTPFSPITLMPGATNTTFTLNFTEPVVGVSTSTLSIDRGASITSVTASGNSYSVTVSNLATGTNTLTVPATVSDLCGNTLGTARTVEINSPSTDQTPPTIVSTTPVDGATNVARDTDIVVRWNEAMNQTRGFTTVRVNGSSVNRTVSWDSTTTLRIDPNADLPFGALVEVILSNFADTASNAATAQTFAFRTVPDPCAVYPATVNVVSGNQDGILSDASGEVWALVQMDDSFPLQESQIAVTPTVGTGSLVAGSLTGSNEEYAFRISGTAPGDVYEVAIGAGTQNGGCTTLTAKTYDVSVPGTISVSTEFPCPLPAPAAVDFTGGDACGATPTNDTEATATQTGLVVDAIGDVVSISGTYDSQGTDFDHFAFSVVEDGVNSKDLLISAYHGCNYPLVDLFTPVGSDPWELRFETTSGSLIGSQFYGDPGVLDAYNDSVAALARVVRTVDGAAGTNTYLLELDETSGGSWCMDFRIFIEVIDTGRPATCAHTPLSVEIENTPQQAYGNEFTGEANFDISLSADFGSLTEDDINVIPLGNARGSLKPSSLTGGGSSYTAELGGVRTGDTYLVTLSPGATSCTTVNGSGFYLTITDDPFDAGDSGACPLPSTLAQNHFGADACNAQTNGTISTSEPTGLSLQNVGDRFSVAGVLDTDFITGSDDDWYAFTVNENGTNIYEFDVSLFYGCNFDDSTGTNDPLTINVVDDTGTVVSSGVGSIAASTTSSEWQSVSTTARVAGGSGANTYHLEIDDQSGSGLCIDYVVFAELVEVSGDATCLGRGSGSSLATTSRSLTETSGVATAVISLTAGYTLTAADLSLTANTGTGTLDATTFTAIDDATYEVDITGVAVGDDYTLAVAGGTDSCGTTLTGGDIALTIANLPTSSGSCPLPGPLPNNYDLGEVCSDSDSNQTQSTAADTGFVLANPGDAFSITSTYDTSSGSSGFDYDWFAFEIDNTTAGTYTLDIRFAYGCGLSGTSSPSGTDAIDVQLRDSSGGSTTDISGDTSYDGISGGTTYGYGQATRTVTPSSSGLVTYYIWMDDPQGSGFCFDTVTYVTLDAKN